MIDRENDDPIYEDTTTSQHENFAGVSSTDLGIVDAPENQARETVHDPVLLDEGEALLVTKALN